MKRTMEKKRFRVLTLSLSLMIGMAAAFSSYATSTQMEDAKKKVSALEEEKKKMEGTLKELEGLKSDAAAYVKRLDADLSSLAAELTQLEGEISQKEEEIAQARVRLQEAKTVEAHQYDTMKLRIKYMYENGETSFMDSIVRSQSISELLNRAEYVSQIAEYDRRMLREYAAAKEAVRAEEETLSKEHEALLGMQESTEAKQASVQKLLSTKKAELAAFQTKIASAQSEIDQYEADIKAQEDEMKKIEAEMKRREEEARKKAAEAGKTYTVSNLGNISFKWPCPSSSRITSRFGDRESPTEGASSNHKGIDIGASTGSAIVAAADGEVVISTYSYSAGNYIMIDHGGGVSTVYMHCSQLLVSKGAKVTKGQTIAKVGSTGYSTGPHLHFGIRSGGSYVNPQKYVSP
ncbi:peptidoglycan DD-metalloendopeptidase family protein [Lacrimispora sp. 210928-DFI.3.58]|nr:peptidoglycan DD-metalloendopeptidase family protein [Lacrimispora sp. 210928-DFI.3.58]MCB7320429.1 peptidoglycan DD-metalloendopeptidase family protein [Lacrimispora sp. 210928-DFI.3.58]